MIETVKSKAPFFAFRLLKVLAGLASLAFGIVLYLRAGLGVDAFTVFYAGFARTVGLSTGRALQICLATLIAVIFLLDRHRLGLGTLMHAGLVGVFIDAYADLPIPVPPNAAAASAMLLLAVAATSSGLALYIHAGLGAGAIDALMLIIHSRLKLQIRWAKVILDAAFAAGGFLLGGPLGVGTVVSAALTGPAIQKMLRFYDRVHARFGLPTYFKESRHEA